MASKRIAATRSLRQLLGEGVGGERTSTQTLAISGSCLLVNISRRLKPSLWGTRNAAGRDAQQTLVPQAY
jgi:hypothetical protein